MNKRKEYPAYLTALLLPVPGVHISIPVFLSKIFCKKDLAKLRRCARH